MKEKLQHTSHNAIIAKIVILFVMVYLLMIIVKVGYFYTANNSYPIVMNINMGTRWIIAHTYFIPLSYVWEAIPSTFENGDSFFFFKLITPPMAILVICSLFINDHLSLKKKYYRLKNKIEEEKELYSMRKDAGIDSLSDSATIDIRISNVIGSDISWHNTWWGRIVIGLLIALIAVLLGFK